MADDDDDKGTFPLTAATALLFENLPGVARTGPSHWTLATCPRWLRSSPRNMA